MNFENKQYKQVNTIQGLINIINKSKETIDLEHKSGIYNFYNSEKLDKILINTEVFFFYYAKGILPSQTESYKNLKNSFKALEKSLNTCSVKNNKKRNETLKKHIENNNRQINCIEQLSQDYQG